MWSGPVAATKSYQTCSSQSDPEDGHRIRTPKNLHCHIHDRMNALEWSFQRELEMCFNGSMLKTLHIYINMYRLTFRFLSHSQFLTSATGTFMYLQKLWDCADMCHIVSYCVICVIYSQEDAQKFGVPCLHRRRHGGHGGHAPLFGRWRRPARRRSHGHTTDAEAKGVTHGGRAWAVGDQRPCEDRLVGSPIAMVNWFVIDLCTHWFFSVSLPNSAGVPSRVV